MPVNVSSTPSVTALLGENATLVCQWQDDTNCPTTTTLWWKCTVYDENCTEPTFLRECKLKASTQTLGNKSCNWTITNVQLEDGGKYKCQVGACVPEDSFSELVVNGKK